MNASLPPLAQVDWSGQLRTLAARFGDRIAARDGEAGTMSYAEFSARAHAVAVHLLDQGLPAGTPVASLLPNSLEAIWVSFGIKLAGLCEVPLGWGYTADEIRWCAQVSGAKVLITREARAALAGEAGLHPMISADIALHDRGGALSPVPGPTPGRILFTSGTTGRPKGVLASHGRRWIGEQLQKACLPFMPQPGSKILLMTPFVHGSGLLSAAWLDCGGEITLHDGVDPARVRPLLESGNYEAMFAPPTVLAKLVGAFDGASLPGLRCIFTGTQPLARGLYERARQ
ncbi:MAG: AMP-binding protein, partial [Burkholderiaceae bacterium]